MAYSITGRRGHVIRSRGTLSAHQALDVVKEMQQDGFDVLSIVDASNRPLTVEALAQQAGSGGSPRPDLGQLAT